MIEQEAERATAERKAAMAVLAQAPAPMLAEKWAAMAGQPAWSWLREPQAGLVMVRGRTGGGGAPFNLGEVTVTRCALELETGQTGFAWIMGRDAEKARHAALFDALWQDEARRGEIERDVLAPLRAAIAAEDARRDAETAATKVDFFTLVRGED